MKNLPLVVSLVLLFCFTFSCQNKAEKAELEKFRAQAKFDEQNKVPVIKETEVLSKWDFAALKELFAPEYLFDLPSRTTKPSSREAQIESLKRFYKAFSDLSWNDKEIIPVGDKVITMYLSRGTHKGEYQGIPAIGNQIKFRGIAIIRIENRKLVERKEEDDISPIMLQLGMELKPKEVKKIGFHRTSII